MTTIIDDILPSFFSEMRKIAGSKLKISGEETVDVDNAYRTLEQTTKRMPRDTHPAMNLEGEKC